MNIYDYDIHLVGADGTQRQVVGTVEAPDGGFMQAVQQAIGDSFTKAVSDPVLPRCGGPWKVMKLHIDRRQ